MASIHSRLFTLILRLIDKKGFLRRQLERGRFNRFDCPEPPSFLFGRIIKKQLEGRNVFTLSPQTGEHPQKHILYLHGGAYVQCFTLPHWYFLADIMNKTGIAITAPDYPLAPEHTYKEAFCVAEKVYLQLIEQYGSGSIVLMGDSAGGGFALALLQKLKKDHLPLPEQTILLSPWLDISLTNPAIDQIDPLDPFLDKQSLQSAGSLYAGNTPPSHYQLSPIYGTLEGLGKITVFAGAYEILVADARKLKSMAMEKGISLDYYEYPEMIHTWMLLNFPESRKARQEIFSLLRDNP